MSGPSGEEGPSLARVRLVAPARAMPGLLDALEPLADAVSVFEQEVDADAEPVSFAVDLWLTRRPDAEALARELAPLCARFGFAPPDRLEVEEQPPETWLEAATTRGPPTSVGRFFIHPDPADPVPAGSVPILLEAGLAFGSGEHATTRLCLLALGRLARHLHRARVLDLGCGSGILAIAAAKLADCRVWAADNDPIAVRVARENVRRNGVAGRVCVLSSEGLARSELRAAGPFDLILANILADPLVELAPELARALVPGGHLALSGFLERQMPAVAAAYAAHGLLRVAALAAPPWAALVLRRRRSTRGHRILCASSQGCYAPVIDQGGTRCAD